MSDLRMELIQGQLNDIEENVRSIKSTWGNTIMTLDNIKTNLKADRQRAIDDAYQKALAYYEIAESFHAIRRPIDKLEEICDDNIWPMPKYRELLWIR